MNLSEDKKWVYCHVCNKQMRISTQCYYYGYGYNPDDIEIRCLNCHTVLGYYKDLHSVHI